MNPANIESSPKDTMWRYFAVYYLYLWITLDKKHYDAFGTSVTAENLRSMCIDYGVARNFPQKGGAGDSPDIYVSFAAEIEAIRNGKGDFSFEGVAFWLEQAYKDCKSNVAQKGNFLSAFTKACWFARRSPIVIYDTLAWDSLWSVREYRELLRTNKFSYAGYFGAWQKYYGMHKDEIEKACVWLIDSAFVESLITRSDLNRQSLIEETNAQWFKERVCDMRLWHRTSVPPAADQALYLKAGE